MRPRERMIGRAVRAEARLVKEGGRRARVFRSWVQQRQRSWRVRDAPGWGVPATALPASSLAKVMLKAAVVRRHDRELWRQYVDRLGGVASEQLRLDGGGRAAAVEVGPGASLGVGGPLESGHGAPVDLLETRQTTTMFGMSSSELTERPTSRYMDETAIARAWYALGKSYCPHGAPEALVALATARAMYMNSAQLMATTWAVRRLQARHPALLDAVQAAVVQNWDRIRPMDLIKILHGVSFWGPPVVGIEEPATERSATAPQTAHPPYATYEHQPYDLVSDVVISPDLRNKLNKDLISKLDECSAVEFRNIMNLETVVGVLRTPALAAYAFGRWRRVGRVLSARWTRRAVQSAVAVRVLRPELWAALTPEVRRCLVEHSMKKVYTGMEVPSDGIRRYIEWCEEGHKGATTPGHPDVVGGTSTPPIMESGTTKEPPRISFLWGPFKIDWQTSPGHCAFVDGPNRHYKGGGLLARHCITRDILQKLGWKVTSVIPKWVNDVASIQS